jgi:Spy/CpxP family protein refolding chaperone
MKKLISVLSAIVLMSIVAFAQPKNGFKGNKGPEQWRERMRAEQVAFITSELNLTEAEAQAFWPVYNEVQQQRREAFKVQMDAMKALKKGVEVGDKTADLLDTYLQAKEKCQEVDAKAIKRYKKVLSDEKVAKLVLAEEKFRHQQIGKLGHKGGERHPSHKGAQRPSKENPVKE